MENKYYNRELGAILKEHNVLLGIYQRRLVYICYREEARIKQ